MSSFRSILVPTDLGPDAERAAQVAAQLATTSGLPVELLTVLGALDDRRLLEYDLRHLQRKLGLPAATTTTTVLTDDDVVGGLVGAIEDRPDTLVVQGTRARGPVGALVLGSVTEAVLSRTDHALLLVGPHVSLPVGPNFVAAAADANAGAALLPTVVHWSRQFVVDPWFVQVIRPTPHWWDRPLGGLETGAVEELATTARAVGVDAHWDVLPGHDAGDAITSFTASMGGGIVAVASRRWAAEGRWHRASTARDLVHRSPFSVLVQPVRDHAVAAA
jgi:nucleotide-binding universal stress UspA family protein